MGRNYRKRTALADDETDEQAEAGQEPKTETGVSLSEALLDTKILQKRRKKEKGVSTDILSGFTSKGLQLIQVVEEEEEDSQQALQDTFANETAVAETDPNMEKYIEAELRKRRGLSEAQEDGGAGLRERTEVQDLQADLYKIPDNLKVSDHTPEEDGAAWMTGIVEVQLPVAHRLANVEATERAKAMLLDKQKEKRFGSREKTTLPASLSANFSLHRSQFAKQGGGGRTTTEQEYNKRQGGPNAGGRKTTATDDVVASRFRARERNRRY